jgi:hypothetical protein
MDMMEVITTDVTLVDNSRGWIQHVLEQHGLTNTPDGWDIVIQEDIASDPEKGIVGTVGHLCSV